MENKLSQKVLWKNKVIKKTETNVDDTLLKQSSGTGRDPVASR